MVRRTCDFFVKVVTGELFGIVLLGLLLVGSCKLVNSVQDARYARSYWGDKVGIERVVASKRNSDLEIDRMPINFPASIAHNRISS